MLASVLQHSYVLESVSSLEDSEEERQKSKKRRKERRSRSSSLSPLSRRSGPQNSRAISPFASKLNPEEGMNRPAEFGGLKKDDLYSNPCPDLARMPVSGIYLNFLTIKFIY